MCIMERVGFRDAEIVAYSFELSALALTGLLQDGNCIGERGAEMIAEGLKVNSSLLELFLVRQFYHHIVLDVFDAKSVLQWF